MNDVERAQRMADYISHVAATGAVEECDVFTLAGGAQDSNSPQWWFLTPPMADVIATADRNPAPPIIIDPIEPEPVEVTPMTRDQARRRALADIWNGELTKADYAPDTAIGAYWEANFTTLGSPCGPERVADDGSVWQGFSLALVCATPGDPWTVERAA